MDKIGLKTAAELIGIAAIVASLVFVGFQMRQAQEIALAERSQAHTANSIELTTIINQHSELWAKGIAGETLDEMEVVMFGNLMQAWNDFYYYASDAASRLGYESSSNYWSTLYGVFLYRNPGARQWWEAHQVDVMDTPRLSMGPMDLEGSVEWYDRVTHVWDEIERTGDLGSNSE